MNEHFKVAGNRKTKKSSKQQKKQQIKFGAPVVDVGFYLVTPLVIGVLAGVFLDRQFDTKPLWTLILLVIGTISSFYNLWRLTKPDGR